MLANILSVIGFFSYYFRITKLILLFILPLIFIPLYFHDNFLLKAEEFQKSKTIISNLEINFHQKNKIVSWIKDYFEINLLNGTHSIFYFLIIILILSLILFIFSSYFNFMWRILIVLSNIFFVAVCVISWHLYFGITDQTGYILYEGYGLLINKKRSEIDYLILENISKKFNELGLGFEELAKDFINIKNNLNVTTNALEVKKVVGEYAENKKQLQEEKPNIFSIISTYIKENCNIVPKFEDYNYYWLGIGIISSIVVIYGVSSYFGYMDPLNNFLRQTGNQIFNRTAAEPEELKITNTAELVAAVRRIQQNLVRNIEPSNALLNQAVSDLIKDTDKLNLALRRLDVRITAIEHWIIQSVNP